MFNLSFALYLSGILAGGRFDKGIVTIFSGVKLHSEHFLAGGGFAYRGIKYGVAGRFEHARPNADFSYLADPNRVKGGHCVIGFLSTGDEVAPGNWAIGDLKLALNWTIHNVAAFGGDPTKITIFGESSGGVLTSALLLDENVSQKVKGGIAFSGSILAGWAVIKSPKVGTLMLAGNLGCPNTTSAEAVSCLKALPYETLLNGTLPLEKGVGLARKALEELDTCSPKTSARSLLILTLPLTTPVADGLHLTKLPEDILRARAGAPDKSSEKKRANIVSGYLREDAALYTLNLMFGVSAMKESMLYAHISDDANQMFLISYDIEFKRMGAFHCMQIHHLFRGSCHAFLKAIASEAVSEALTDHVHLIVYTGRYEGPYFGQEGHYHELTQDGNFVNKKADFAAKVRLLEDLLSCGAG
ncbi:hypothetical protein RvY_04148 [Ramazzottius varieornatus]|uniref:Carboxylic ester hydrolase n=1 Tax=Ramazzottius varieornatus TaxID=947166 RepID=A0A1D1UQJ6_RAMVA|nr:hypothetical protein RvY_04148 [Ramazzottius varieornatus]